jgi:hypothetical protein
MTRLPPDLTRMIIGKTRMLIDLGVEEGLGDLNSSTVDTPERHVGLRRER